MCGTCGCSDNGLQIKMILPGEENVISENFPLENHAHHHHRSKHHHHHQHHDNGGAKLIEVEQDILRKNDLLAERIRGYMEAKNIFSINLVSSPGSGKTSILERTLSDLNAKHKFYVIEGDQQTMNDANRIAAVGTPVIQINTGHACHLDSSMVYNAIRKLEPENDSFLFIENVGNLVCPAMFDLGESKRVVIMSVTEGEDKAIKYPDMFHSSHLCLINKVDLLPYVDFNVEKAKEYGLQVNHHLEFIEISATKGTGMENWYHWLSLALKPV